MSKVEEFREAVNANEDWQEEVRNFGDDDNIVSYASSKGYEFTENEYSEYVENEISGELSLFETEMVSGGRSRISCACWVAREVYGEFNPQWLLFRRWLLGDSPNWFRNLYISKGEAFANWLSKNVWLKPMIRRWMDGRIRS